MHFYADEATRELLASPEPKVLLYGGFEGFDNYGDVIQAKGSVDFHRERTGLAPIMIVSMAAWTDPELLQRLRENYDVRGFIFEDGAWRDTSAVGLAPIRRIHAGALLHVYGGGYFNEFWGARRAFVCEQIIFRLHVSEYVISGVQVDEAGVSHLRSLFEKKAPLLVGARDEHSVSLLASTVPSARLRYSFDDAVEPIENLRDRLVRLGAVQSTAERTVGLHMNLTTEYMPSSQRENTIAALREVSARFPDHEFTLLHAYNDRRRIIRDTLGSIDDVGLTATHVQFDVINFATLASRRELDTITLRRLLRSLERLDFVVTSSYHIALTMNLLGKPTYLLASNEYYRDKRAALGLAENLGEFLSDPRSRIRNFSSERRERRDWLVELASVITSAMAPGRGETAEVTVPDEQPTAAVSGTYL